MNEQTTTAPVEALEATSGAQASQAPTPTPAPTLVPAEDQENLKDAQEDTTSGESQDALGKLRKEAAGHRVAAKEARAEAETLRTERDALLTRLTAVQDSILAGELDRHGVTLDALKAAGHRDSVFNEDGTLNTDALAPAMKDTAARFGSTRHMAPVPELGRETPPGGGNHAPARWHTLLNG